MKVSFPNIRQVRLDQFDRINFTRKKFGEKEFYASKQHPFLVLGIPENFPINLEQVQALKEAGIFMIAIRRAQKSSAYLMFDHQYADYAWHDATLRKEVEFGKAALFHVDSHNDVNMVTSLFYRDLISRKHPFLLKREEFEKELLLLSQKEVSLIPKKFQSYLNHLAREEFYGEKAREDNFLAFARAFFTEKHDLYVENGAFYLERNTPWYTEKSFRGTYCNEGYGAEKNWEREQVNLGELSKILLARDPKKTALDTDADTFEAGREYYYENSSKRDHPPVKRYKINVNVPAMKIFAEKILKPFKGVITLVPSPNYTSGNSGLEGVRESIEILT